MKRKYTQLLLLHQDLCCCICRWINIFRLLFGVKVEVLSTAFVIGLLVFPLFIQDVIAALSYVYPSISKTEMLQLMYHVRLNRLIICVRIHCVCVCVRFLLNQNPLGFENVYWRNFFVFFFLYICEIKMCFFSECSTLVYLTTCFKLLNFFFSSCKKHDIFFNSMVFISNLVRIVVVPILNTPFILMAVHWISGKTWLHCLWNNKRWDTRCKLFPPNMTGIRKLRNMFQVTLVISCFLFRGASNDLQY